jgi:hypothetical protein
VRTRAAEELSKRSLAANAQGNLHEASHLARLAAELEPQNVDLRDLAATYERELSQSPDAAALLFLADAGAGTSSSPHSGGGQALSGTRATLDATPAKPKLGQPVDFTAKVATRSPVTDAHFQLVGPGLGAGAKLAALSDGAAFRAGFTFLEAGKFEVSFTAKVDDKIVRTARVVVVESATSPSPTVPSGDATGNTPPTAPTGSVKWL